MFLLYIGECERARARVSTWWTGKQTHKDLSLSLSLSLTHTHRHTHLVETRAHTGEHANTHINTDGKEALTPLSYI